MKREQRAGPEAEARLTAAGQQRHWEREQMESSKTAKALAIASDRYNVFYSDTGLHEVNVPRSYLERLAKGGYVIQGSEIDGTPFTIEPGATEGG